jgi:hypothetical protein
MRAKVPVAARQIFTHDGERFDMQLWQPKSAAGGFVAEYRQIEGQSPMLRVYYLDSHGYTERAPLRMREAIGRLIRARDRANERPAKPERDHRFGAEVSND